ncbi:MAG: sigma-70 family RNA polymerase sigma factor [Verrucomicrobia bacterium]|nr:sigma-70 family RNA polymerase sigma factor [Verrucomicrobiota bacterium]
MDGNADLLPALQGPAGFRTTHWSVVLAAGRTGSTIAHEALEHLCRDYWYPLYADVRRRGYPPEEAKDLTQGFFASLLRREDLARVGPEKGRFRTFLLTALDHYLANERDRTRAQKRGGGRPALSLDDETAENRYRHEPADPLTPATLFERRWAATVLERVTERLRGEYAAAEKGDLFDELEGFLTEKKARARAEIAARHGVGINAVDVAIHRLRKRYRALLREEIARTVSRPEEVEEEIRALIHALGQGAAPG